MCVCVCVVVDCGLCCHRQCSVSSSLPKCVAAAAVAAAAADDDGNSESQVQLSFMPG